jgi:hypothetical protein
LGKLNFLRSGLTKVCLNSVGNEPSPRERLIRVVIGIIRASRHDLSRGVGIISREQVESFDERIDFLTSAGDANWKL